MLYLIAIHCDDNREMASDPPTASLIAKFTSEEKAKDWLEAYANDHDLDFDRDGEGWEILNGEWTTYEVVSEALLDIDPEYDPDEYG